MNTKQTERFSKVRKLITILRKCSGKAVIGDGNALISPKAVKILIYCGLLVVTAALFVGAYMVQPHLAPFFPVKSLSQILMLVFLAVSFVLAVKDIVTVLYTSDDLSLLLPMPFSASQIVMAKIAVVSVFPVLLSVVILNSVCLGYGIRGGVGVSFIIGIVLSSILIPVTGIALATLLIVIVFRVFGILRNRDITVALGGIFTFGLGILYVFFNNRIQSGDAGKLAASLNAVSSFTGAFPNISFMSRFMFGGSIPGLLASVAVTLAAVLLALLAVRTFYFDTALSMQNTTVSKKAVSRAALRGEKKNGILGALTSYEAKSARRNPAYLIYGFVICFAWPVLFAVPILISDDTITSRMPEHIGTLPALVGFVLFAMAASCLTCGLNILPGSAFSREGSAFSAIRALPIDFTVYFKSKRNFILLLCCLGSVLYVAVLGIICIVTGFISVGSGWTVLAGAVLCFFLDLLLIDLMMWQDARKPRFNWDSETELARKHGFINIIAIIAGFALLITSGIAFMIGQMLEGTMIMKVALILCAVIGPVVVAAALIMDKAAVRSSAESLMKFE